MKERAEWLDVVAQQLVDEPVVICDAFVIRLAGSLRENTRPGNRKTVALSAEPFQKLHIFLVAVVLVGRHIAGFILVGLAGSVGKSIPDGRSPSVDISGAFHLVGGCRTAP